MKDLLKRAQEVLLAFWEAAGIVWLAATPLVILVLFFGSSALLGLIAGEAAPWIAFVVVMFGGPPALLIGAFFLIRAI